MKKVDFYIGNTQVRFAYESLQHWKKSGYPIYTWVLSAWHLKPYIFRAKGFQITVLGCRFGVFLNSEVNK